VGGGALEAGETPFVLVARSAMQNVRARGIRWASKPVTQQLQQVEPREKIQLRRAVGDGSRLRIGDVASVKAEAAATVVAIAAVGTGEARGRDSSCWCCSTPASSGVRDS
jgi:hypothetical protein